MPNFYRVSLGEQGKDADLALHQGWIGTGWLSDIDLTGKLPETHAQFRREFNPVILEIQEVKTPIAAGLACGMTFTVSKFMEIGDVVFSGKANGDFQVGQVSGDYYYAKGQPQPHRRPVKWFPYTVKRSYLSPMLRSSLSVGTVQAWSGYKDIEKQQAFEKELEDLAAGRFPNQVLQESFDEQIRFHAELELEDFLEKHWSKTSFANEYEFVTRQMQLDDAGRLDILAKSRDGKEYLIIELKLGRASDKVVGQLLAYMGYLKNSDLCSNGETVKGLIIGSKDDAKIRHALNAVDGIEFYLYEMQFNLKKVI